jgi:S-(hydroxymethyl)glutathione dehydrogenase/alcohol dehydrogenase
MRAAVLTEINGPLEVIDLIAPIPQTGQVLVDIQTSGLCGAQLQEIRGEKGNSRFIPHLMGHEGFGFVREVGPGVEKVRKGDAVTLHWRQGSGLGGAPPKYESSSLGQVGGGPVTTLASMAVISENRLTRVPPETSPALGALLGCALTTSFGLVQNQLEVPFGAKVAVLGCGGLGLSLIAALRSRGAGMILGVDSQKSKRSLALTLGATDFMQTLSERVDLIIDTTGVQSFVEDSMEQLNPGGQVALLVNNSQSYVFPSYALFAGNGMKIIPTQGGLTWPDVDIPRLELFLRNNQSVWQELITHVFPLNKINEAIEVLKSGVAGRILIETVGA